MARPKGEPSWKWRRAIILSSTVFSFYLIYHMIDGPDTSVNATIAQGLMFLIAGLVFAYTGLATVQDVAAIWRTGSATPYKEEPPVNDPMAQ